jgi:methionine-rich copper-binding protein CopC
MTARPPRRRPAARAPRRPGPSWAALAAILGLVLLLPMLAAAHASLVKSSPARRATLTTAPARVELTFNERLEPAYATVSVWDGTGRQVDLKDGAVPREDSRRLAVSLPALPAGTYTVRFRVLSVDGHVVESSFPFTVREPAR